MVVRLFKGELVMKFTLIIALSAMMLATSAFARKGTQWGPGGGNLIGCFTSDSVHAHCYCSGNTGNNCTTCGPGDSCTFPVAGGGTGSGSKKSIGGAEAIKSVK
jgi:hypothetical protein